MKKKQKDAGKHRGVRQQQALQVGLLLEYLIQQNKNHVSRNVVLLQRQLRKDEQARVINAFERTTQCNLVLKPQGQRSIEFFIEA